MGGIEWRAYLQKIVKQIVAKSQQQKIHSIGKLIVRVQYFQYDFLKKREIFLFFLLYLQCLSAICCNSKFHTLLVILPT